MKPTGLFLLALALYLMAPRRRPIRSASDLARWQPSPSSWVH